MKLMRFLLGLVIGAGVAVLVTPKSGREMRRQLVGGATGRLLPAAPVEFPQPEGGREWDDEAGVAVAEKAPEPVAEGVWTPEPALDIGNAVVVEELADDLKARIDETRAAVESEIAQPFGSVEEAAEEAAAADVAEAAEAAVTEAAVADVIAEQAVAEALVAEAVAEEAAVEAVAAEAVAEEAARDAVAAEIVAEEAYVEAVVTEAVAEEAVVEAMVEDAVAEQPAVDDAVAEQPAVEEAVAEAVVEEPVAEQSAVEPPVLEEPTPSAPPAWDVAHEGDAVVEAAPVVDESSAVERPPAAVELPVAEDLPEAVEEPVLEQGVVVAESPLAEEEPPTAEAVGEERPGLVADIAAPVSAAVPVVEPAPAAEPVAEEPTARAGGSIDQAEMRRRIEETRARLKAKAFDAMMSGEAALLSRDSGETTVPSGEDVKLDAETDSTIDESLSQEDY